MNLFTELGSAELSILVTPFDLKRLESYANNMLDYHVVLDLLPTIASLFFEKRLGDEIRLSAVQSSILLALGSQRKSIEEVEVSAPLFVDGSFSMTLSAKTELQLPVAQALALFAKVVRKISKRLNDIQKAAIGASIPEAAATPSSRVNDERADWVSVGINLDDELTQAGNDATDALRVKQREMIDSLDLSK